MSIDSDSIALTRNIAEYLQHVKGGAVTAPALSSAFHIHPSAVRGCINLARTMGIPICATSKGYFYSTNKEDIKATIAHMEERIAKQRNAIIGLKAAIGE